MKIAIIKYNAGNICSVINALKRLGIDPVLTDEADVIRTADRVVFPGQGEASSAMACLREHGLDEVIRSLQQPVLGICIGQQLLCRHSEEGDTDCLGIIPADVKRFAPLRHEDKVPAMGWLPVRWKGDDSEELPSYYFVHSYYVPRCEWTLATTNYIAPYSAALHKDNFWSTQFHPEKSGPQGEALLHKFIREGHL
ncbi:MAG: imidazole glycerol phosphate synthase subunit HisH [Prevotella sp.]|nr:imidazole glycerol phosphate synthase subunit HisH [Prevotella sp.]